MFEMDGIPYPPLKDMSYDFPGMPWGSRCRHVGDRIDTDPRIRFSELSLDGHTLPPRRIDV